MPAARLWRITGLTPWGDVGLELSALHLYDDTGRVDVGATLTCSHAPVLGALAALQDTDADTLCAFGAAAVRSPGFWLQWDLGDGNAADVWCLRVGAGTEQDAFLSICFLQYFDGAVWVAAEMGAYPWPGSGGLTAASAVRPVFAVELGVWAPKTAAGSRNWTRCAISADGQTIASVAQGDYLWLSKDAGATWAQQTAAGSRNWLGCAVSADGQTIVASVASGGYLYTSVNAGATWVQQTAAGSRNWIGCAISADGQTIVGSVGGSYMLMSTDAGATWEQQTAAGSRSWGGCAISADGQTIVGSAGGFYMLMSTDAGATWVQQTAAGSRNWTGCAISADGQTIVGLLNTGYLWLSSDAGATWAEQTAAGSLPWYACAISADGQALVGAAYGYALRLSRDRGASWQPQSTVGAMGWRGAAISADGKSIVVAEQGGFLRTVRLRSAQYVELRSRTLRTQATPVFTRPADILKAIAAQHARLARDTAYGGNGTIRDTVQLKGTPSNTPLRRRVRLYSDRSGEKVRETWSDAATGIYEFASLDTAQQFAALAGDHERVHQAVAADNLTPKVLP